MFSPRNFSLINTLFLFYSLSSFSVSPSALSSLKLHRHLRNFSPDSPSPISIAEASHGLSLIFHRGSASWVWIGGLGSIDGWFETVDLLIGGWIGWVDHR